MVFQPGVSGNPGGRRQGQKNAITVHEFTEALKRVEAREKVNLIDHYIMRALKNDLVLINLMKKIMPDLVAQSNESAIDMMERVSSILKKLKFNEITDIKADADGQIVDKGPGDSGTDQPVSE